MKERHDWKELERPMKTLFSILGLDCIDSEN
jgi:hypothetical protein